VSRWQRIGSPVAFRPDADEPGGAVGWAWLIRREGDERSVRVEVVGGPFRVTDLPAESRNAIRSRGATAVDAYLVDDEPPDLIVVSTLGVRLERDS
jgi:hypothetical protein